MFAGSRSRVRRGCCAAFALLMAGLWGCAGSAQLPAIREAATQAVETAAAPAMATVTGVITDSDGAAIANARVRLSSTTAGYSREQVTGTQGRYAFAGVPVGRYTLWATAPGFGESSLNGVTINAGTHELLPLALQAAMNTTVDAITQEQLAEEQIHDEERQRLLGVIPNFFVTYDWHAQPLTKKQKYTLEWKFLEDPVNHAVAFGVAGVEQADNSLPGYGQGATGYFKRLAAAEGDFTAGNLIGGAVLPALLHQDPRYFYKGTGSVWSRTLYALSTAVICRGDNGRWQFSYSGVGGDLAAGAISNLYYPKSSRDSATVTLRNGFISVGTDGLQNVVQEFVLKHVTRKKQ